ncbi:MAG: hypothetical protein MI723_00890 [Caulobacterales bacterium]|nr:hypothetical protein [Caulobacterales bacterium]
MPKTILVLTAAAAVSLLAAAPADAQRGGVVKGPTGGTYGGLGGVGGVGGLEDLQLPELGSTYAAPGGLRDDTLYGQGPVAVAPPPPPPAARAPEEWEQQLGEAALCVATGAVERWAASDPHFIACMSSWNRYSGETASDQCRRCFGEVFR